MAEAHTLPAPKSAGHLQPVSTVLRDLLSSKGYRPIAPTREKELVATTCAMILVGAYRKDDAASAEVRIAAFAAVLAEYPDDCIRYVTDPRTGIQSFRYTRHDHNGREVKGPFKAFPPEPGELQEACEQYMAPILRRQQQERRTAEQVREREEDRARAARRAERPVLPMVARPPSVGAELDRMAARIAAQIEYGARVRRVEEDLVRRRAARSAAA